MPLAWTLAPCGVEVKQPKLRSLPVVLEVDVGQVADSQPSPSHLSLECSHVVTCRHRG